MAYLFPNAPTLGQVANGFVWNGQAWTGNGNLATSAPPAQTPPASPVSGQLWWESDSGNLFIWYDDASADTGQWVQISGSVTGQAAAAFDFPATPTLNQIYAPVGGPSYTWNGTAWLFTPIASAATQSTARNRVTNPAMQISQENGSTYGAITSVNYYFADQWAASSTIATAGATRNPNAISGAFRLDTAVTTAKPALAAGDVWQVFTDIEGTGIADFLWGTVSAKQVILRFSCYATIGGTFGASLRNITGDRSYLASFTLATATWTTVTLVIPGDTAGTWHTGAGHGVRIVFGLAAGTTYGNGVAGWQAGNKIQITGSSNLAATANAGFTLSDVGLYLDDQLTGVPPRWGVPDPADELRACQRYYEVQRAILTMGTYGYTGVWGATKRIEPALSTTPDGGTGGAFSAVNMGLSNYTQGVAHSLVAAATIKANARM